MKLLVCSAILCSSLNAMAATTFEADATGQAPAGWTCGATGRGAPKWSVEIDPSAPNKGKVLRQSGTATFPWCVKTDAKLDAGIQGLAAPTAIEQLQHCLLVLLCYQKQGIMRTSSSKR